MQLLKQWSRGEGSRKRAAEESNQESLRKRMKDDTGRRELSGPAIAIAIATATASESGIASETATGSESAIAIASEGDQESNINNHSLNSLNSSTSLSTASIHPDRRNNIFNIAPTPTPIASASLNQSDSPLGPLPQSSEHIDEVEPEGPRPEPLHSTSHLNLHIDTVRTGGSLDSRSPDSSSIMTPNINEKSRDSPSHDPRIPSGPKSTPSSRRQSGNMLPPPQITKITRSEDFTSKPTSPLTNSKSERRPSSNIQAQATLLESLNEFAQSITANASLTVKSDLLRQQAVSQQMERDRQSKRKSIFLTLVEDAESRVEGIEKASVEIDNDIDLSSQTQSKNVSTLAARLLKESEVSNALSSAHNATRLKDEIADIKEDLKTTKFGNSRDRGRFKDDLIDLKDDLKAAGKIIDNVNREAVTSDELRRKLHSLATKDELRGLVTKDEVREMISKADTRRFTTDEVRKQITEALIPTEKKLASLTLQDASLNRIFNDAEASIQKYCDTVEEKLQEQSSRFGPLNISLSESRTQLSRLDLEQQNHFAALEVDLDTHKKLLADLTTRVGPDSSNKILSFNKIIMNNSYQISLLQEGFEKMNKKILQQTHDLQAASKLGSPQVSTLSVKTDTKLVEEVKLMQSDLNALKAEQEDYKPVRYDLDALRADREKVELIRIDLDSLIDGEKQKDTSVAQAFDMITADLKTQREKYQQTLHDFETRLTKLTQTSQSLDVFVRSQQQIFDRLTSDHVVQNMIHQLQHMYPHHPGNLGDWMSRLDRHVTGNLAPRVATIESQIIRENSTRASADTKTQERIQEVSRLSAETGNKCSPYVSKLGKDIENLRGDYDNRMNGLGGRVATIEATHSKAIADLRKNQTDMGRHVTHLRRRDGTGSTVMSRSSTSVEPAGSTTITCGISHDSDSSDRPLSARRERGDGRPSGANLKRKTVDSDSVGEEGVWEGRPPNLNKVPRRRNVSGQNPIA